MTQTAGAALEVMRSSFAFKTLLLSRVGSRPRVYAAPTASSLAGLDPVTNMTSTHLRADSNDSSVSVVIVSWNTRDLLRDCLHSINQQTRLRHEIVVVDNASSDGSAEMVEREFPEVILLINRDNRGFAIANNQGIRATSGYYVLLLNPDTVILDGAIDKMVRWLDEHPGVGCAGCQILETETEIQRTCFSDPGPFNLLLMETALHRVLHDWPLFCRPAYGQWDRRTERDVDVVHGMFMLTSRLVIEQVGLLDEDFFVYSEEADWCRRIRKSGYRCAFTPVARVLHRDGGGNSTIQSTTRMFVQFQKSRLLYVQKYYGVAGRTAARFILFCSMFARWTLFGAMSCITGDVESRTRSRLGRATLRFLLSGAEPTS